MCKTIRQHCIHFEDDRTSLNNIVNMQQGLRASFGACGTTTYLIRKSGGSEISKRKLESSVATLDIDLESYKSVGICR